MALTMPRGGGGGGGRYMSHAWYMIQQSSSLFLLSFSPLLGCLAADLMVQLLKSAERTSETWQNVESLTVAAQKVNVVKYGELDHQSLTGLHANSCYSVRSQWSPAFCLFLSNLSLIQYIYEVTIGQPK